MAEGFDEEMKEIPLTQGKVALVDDEDYVELSKYRWCAAKSEKTFYVSRHSPSVKGKRHTLLMHRVIMHPPEDMEIDHINGNGLDNQKVNLRIVTTRQNGQNRHQKKTSKYPGVSWNKELMSWCANIQIKGRKRYLGAFNDEKKAADAYQTACKNLEIKGELT